MNDVLIDALALFSLPPSDVLVVDCRFELSDPGKGGREFLQAHIPHAVYASLDRDLSDLSKKSLGRHPLPDERAFSQTLSRWSWTKRQRVIAYDDAGARWQPRVCGGCCASVASKLSCWTAVGAHGAKGD